MEVKVSDGAVIYVLKYLNQLDLKRMSLVCRSWWKISREEEKLRSPIFLNVKSTDKSEIEIITNDPVYDTIRHKPHLLMCFSYDNNNLSHVLERSFDHLAPIYCYSIVCSRKDIVDQRNDNQFSTLVIPYTPKIKWLSLTYVSRTFKEGFYCQETGQFFNANFGKYIEMKSKLNKYIDCRTKDGNAKCFMILLCENNFINRLKDLVIQLREWYPNTNIPTWGATVYKAKLHNKLKYEHFGDVSKANIIQMLVTGQNMLARYLILEEDCNTMEKIEMKFQDFKKTIKFKEYSIAFMCTSNDRYSYFYETEMATFKKIFPKVTLVHIYGKEPVGGKNFDELFKNLMKFRPWLTNKNTTLLLISYDN